MSRRSRREQETFSTPTGAAAIVDASGKEWTPADVRTLHVTPDTICFVGLGHLKDGRHVAFEACVDGRKVVRWTPICAKATVDAPERAWWQIHYARLYLRRELTETEQAANECDTIGVLPEHFESGKAVAIHGNGKSTVALAVSLEGMTVTEPEVLTKAPRDFCMLAIGRWAGLNMLPRRKL